MRNTKIVWMALVAAAVLVGALTRTVHAQFSGPETAVANLKVAEYPPDIQKDFGEFKTRCSACHGLSSSLALHLSAPEWESLVKRMQAMASAHLSDRDVRAVTAFLAYNDERTKPAAAAPGAAVNGSSENNAAVEAGLKFYEASGCDACHSIRGQGNTTLPLDGVGSRLSRKDLIQRMEGRRAGSVMPPLPRDVTDQQINELVAYLLTLK